MAKTLSKIKKELNVSIKDISKFLNENGYECEENPSMEIPEDVVDYVRNNIYAYIKESEATENILNVKKEIIKDSKIETPIELELIDCVAKNKLLIENIIGFTDFEWQYSVSTYHGICSKPVKFTVFDEVISKLLLKKEMSLSEMGKILGLNILDKAEKNILLSAISDLENDKMIEGDESCYWLTETGKEYAKNGVKYSTYERDFKLYIDSTTGFKGNCRKIFEPIKSLKITDFSKEKIPNKVEEVKPLAEIQAPEIHFPKNQYILQSCNHIGTEGYKALLWVVLLENFRDQTIRALVYDEGSKKIIEELSESLNKEEDLKQSILESLIEKDKETTENNISYTDEEKTEEQKNEEQKLIETQEEVDKAIDEEDTEKVKDIVNDIREHKRHFNTVEFEVELKRLFDNTKCDMWIISPWIKKYATSHRVPFFEQYLRKGGRIFISYSKPENGIDLMAEPEALKQLEELECKYNNFYIYQDEPFHYKYVWVRGAQEGDWFYSGSFNILSFYVKKGLTKVRQEMMSRTDWGKEEDEYSAKIMNLFGNKYLKKVQNQISKYKLEDIRVTREIVQEIRSINVGKLNPFISNINEDFDKEVQSLIEQKEDLYQKAKNLFYQNEIDNLKKDVMNLVGLINVPTDKKKDVQSRLNCIKNEYSEIEESINEVQEQIDKIKVVRLTTYKNTQNKQKGKFKYKKKK